MIHCRILPAVRLLGLVLACFVALNFTALAQQAPDLTGDVDLTADSLEMNPDQKIMMGHGNVVIVLGDATLKADEVAYEMETNNVTASGNVTIVTAEMSWQGDSIRGNLKDKSFDFNSFDATLNQWIARGKGARRNADGVTEIDQAALTTCDDWWLEARRVVHRPDGSFVAYHVFYKAFGVPLFYLPYVKGNTNRKNSPIELEIGSQATWGLYVIASKEWRVNDHLDTRLFGEFRTKRGLAIGNETQYRTAHTTTDSLLYVMSDSEPLSDRTVGGTDYNGRFETEDTRYRVRLAHRGDWLEDDALTIRGTLDWRSDNDILFEFFRDEYDVNPQPVSMADASYQQDRWAVSANTRLRLNSFETVVERMPEVRFDLPRQSIFDGRLQVQNETSLAYLRMNWADYDLARDDGLADSEDYEALRFDSLTNFYYPLSLHDWRIIPRAGIRLTYYDKTSDTDVTNAQLNSTFAANGRRVSPANTALPFSFDEDGGGALRLAGELGFEVTTKYYRTWNNYHSDFFNLNGLRHVVEPYINHTYIPEPTEDKENLLFFDSTDRIDNVNFTRFGVKQRWQTRRNDQIYTFAKLETYTDLYIEPEDDADNAGDVGVVGELMPHEHLSFWAKFLFDVGDTELDAFNAGVFVGDRKKLWASLSYLYRNDYTSRYAYSMGSDLTQVLATNALPLSFDESHTLDFRFGFPIGSKDRVAVTYQYDIEQSKLALQRYEWQHDFRCWIAALRVQEESSNVSVMIVLYMRGINFFRIKTPSMGTSG